MKIRLNVLLVIAALVSGLQVVPPAAHAGESSPFAFLGEFSNVRHTTEHAYGYTVQLWREGDRVFGIFTEASGPATDTPAGLLEDVHFNPATGALAFSARLSVGAIYRGQGKQEPTHDLFVFKGSLHASRLTGVLTHTDKSQTQPPATHQHVRLPKSSNPAMIEAANYDQWKQAVGQILQVRGPKW